jgi:hypothetical protein
LEGLLDTIVNRGKDLQRELDENKKIEERLRREIEAELAEEPNAPVITEPPKLDEISPTNSTHSSPQPTTPKRAKSKDDAVSQPILHTPEESTQEGAFILGGPRSEEGVNGGSPSFETSEFLFSPNSIDNSDLNNPGLPSYRRAPEEETMDSFAFGCGAVFLPAGVRLFSESNNSNTGLLAGLSLDEADTAPQTRERSNSTDGPPSLGTPSLTSSFDTIDFRTGMSGHRALMSSKSRTSFSPVTRVGGRMMMSEHRGIGRVRGPAHHSNNAANSPSFRPRYSLEEYADT